MHEKDTGNREDHRLWQDPADKAGPVPSRGERRGSRQDRRTRGWQHRPGEGRGLRGAIRMISMKVKQ